MPKTIVGLKSLIVLIKTKPHLMHYSLYNLAREMKEFPEHSIHAIRFHVCHP